jgi:hypothetical protein
MLKSRRKLLLIGILSLVAITLMVTLGIPALADSFNGKNAGPAALPPAANSATITGNLSVSSNVITITPSTTPSIKLDAAPSQNVTIVYNSSSGIIQGLMLLNPGQTLPMPKNPPANQFSNVNGTLTVSKNVTTITPNASPLISLVAPPKAVVKEMYNKTTGVIQGLQLNGQVQLPPGGIKPPVKPPVANLGEFTGNLTINNNILSVTSQTIPPAPTVSVNQTANVVNIVYNPTTGAVQELRLLRVGQSSTGTAKIVSVNATLTLNGNVITITPNSGPTITLTAPSYANVMVVYNKTTGVIQGLTLGRFAFVPGLGPQGPAMAPGLGQMPGPGMGPFSKPNGQGNPPGQNFMRPNGQGNQPGKNFQNSKPNGTNNSFNPGELKRQAT